MTANPIESFDKKEGLTQEEKNYIEKTDIEKVFKKIKAEGGDLYGEVMVNIHRANSKERLDNQIVNAGLTNDLIEKSIKTDPVIGPKYQEALKKNTTSTWKNNDIILLQALAAKCVEKIKYKNKDNKIIEMLKKTSYFKAANPIDGFMGPNTTLLFSLIAKQELGTNKGGTDVQNFNGEISSDLILKMYRRCEPEFEGQKEEVVIETPEQKQQKEISNKITMIKMTYGIDVVSDPGEIKNILGDKYIITPLSAIQLSSQLDMLTKELSIYPISFIKNGRIRIIVLTEGKQTNTSEVFNGSNLSSGFYTGKDFLVVGGFDGRKDEVVFHHELFHSFNDSELGNYRSWKKLCKGYVMPKEDPDVVAGDKEDREADQFLYAAKSPIEDQAITANLLIKDPIIILDKAKNDPIRKRKIEVMTGCKINNDFTGFEKDYHPDEFAHMYGKYGFKEKEYYYKRSSGSINYAWRNARINTPKPIPVVPPIT